MQVKTGLFYYQLEMNAFEALRNLTRFLVKIYELVLDCS